MPLYEADFVAQYWNSVFATFLEGLEQGLTPNPDLACNSHIKFGALLQFAQQKGADVLATGHYARMAWRRHAASMDAAGRAAAGAAGAADVRGIVQQQQQQQQQQQAVLLAGADPQKDQTYFLAGLNQRQLASAMFPVGGLCLSMVEIDVACNMLLECCVQCDAAPRGGVTAQQPHASIAPAGNRDVSCG
jgi:tRNA-specific 2-thiouridylase